MSASSHQWVLFGYDLRRLVSGYLDAWREVFWEHGSAGRAVLDQPVHTHDRSADQVDHTASPFEAEVLPADRVLSKTLILPRAVSVPVGDVVAAELAAASPFPAEDTVSGWRIVSRTDRQITVALAIASKSSVMDYVHDYHPDARVDGVEVWARHGNGYVVLQGFGEHIRDGKYSRRLKVLALAGLATVAFLLAAAAVPAVYQAQRLEALEQRYETIRRESREVVQLRADLGEANEHLAHLNRLTSSFARPLQPLNVLTKMIPESAWLQSYQQRGNVIEIQGTAANAAALMQQLSAHTAFEDVRPTSAIRKLGNRELERFQLELTLPGAASEAL